MSLIWTDPPPECCYGFPCDPDVKPCWRHRLDAYEMDNEVEQQIHVEEEPEAHD